MIRFILVLFIMLYEIFYKTKTSLHMIQQNLYNENNRYLKWIKNNSKQFINLDIIIILLIILYLLIAFDIEIISITTLIIIGVLSIIEGLRFKKTPIESQNKKKLVITSRIKRLISTTTILYLIPILVMIINYENIKICWISLLAFSLMIYLNSLIVFIAMIINTPIEKGVYQYYKHKAQKKLHEMPNLKIIGITGSYGKTSSKNILSDILNYKYNALPTPRSLNTYNGLIMTVNNYMDKFTDIFIAEMGAYVKGEIKGLCKLIKPQYGILTTIGTAHLETFGSEENIIEGKFELIESLPTNGFAVLNGDDPKQTNYQLKNKVRVIWIGIENEKADILAKNIKCSNKGTTFDVVLKDTNKSYEFQTKLLGKHNVYNILAAIACGKEFGIEMEEMIQAVKLVQPIEHRLELKKLGNFYMIDDAYNSNPVGAKNACDILNMMPGKKVVVTPGMVELGSKEDEYNKKFGEQIAEVADCVILVGEKKTIPIKEGLLEKGFDKNKIIVLNDVREAYSIIGQMALENEVYALFENDLPDSYNEK